MPGLRRERGEGFGESRPGESAGDSAALLDPDLWRSSVAASAEAGCEVIVLTINSLDCVIDDAELRLRPAALAFLLESHDVDRSLREAPAVIAQLLACGQAGSALKVALATGSPIDPVVVRAADLGAWDVVLRAAPDVQYPETQRVVLEKVMATGHLGTFHAIWDELDVRRITSDLAFAIAGFLNRFGETVDAYPSVAQALDPTGRGLWD